MAGAMKKDDSGGNHVPLITSREPVGPKRGGDAGTTGDEAFRDAITIVIGAWIVLFFLVFTLRNHSI